MLINLGTTAMLLAVSTLKRKQRLIDDKGEKNRTKQHGIDMIQWEPKL